MTETKQIPLQLLLNNEGQIEGVPRNPRQITEEAFDKLKKSLEESDLTDYMPLKVYPYGEQFVVLGGNMRLRALRELGVPDVSCIVVPEGIPVAHLKKIVILDNNEFGEYDWDAIANEWSEEPLEDWGVVLPVQVSEDDFGVDFELPNGKKEDFQQVSFQMSDRQAELVKYAINAAIYSDDFQKMNKDGNDNENGCAIALLASKWLKEEQSKFEDIEKVALEVAAQIEDLKTYLRLSLKASGKTAQYVNETLGTAGMAGHYFGDSQWSFPTREAYEKMRTFMELPREYEECARIVRRYNYVTNLQKKIGEWAEPRK